MGFYLEDKGVRLALRLTLSAEAWEYSLLQGEIYLLLSFMSEEDAQVSAYLESLGPFELPKHKIIFQD